MGLNLNRASSSAREASRKRSLIPTGPIEPRIYKHKVVRSPESNRVSRLWQAMDLPSPRARAMYRSALESIAPSVYVDSPFTVRPEGIEPS